MDKKKHEKKPIKFTPPKRTPVLGILDIDKNKLIPFVHSLDPTLHTLEEPYCKDPTCPCHEDQEEDPAI